MKVQFLSLLILSVLSFTSCTTISYTPKVNLDVSPRTIQKSVMVEKLEDFSPEKDRDNPLGGFSATNPKALSGDLAVEITNAIVTDFATNGVFATVSRQVENPDYVMRGEIKRFVGKSRPTGYYWASTAIYSVGVGIGAGTVPPNATALALGTLPMMGVILGVPVRRNLSEIEIELKLYDKAGNLLSTYTGKGQETMPMSIYNNAQLALPSQTNKAFSQAIMQIRKQILDDSKLN
ncbi:MAG: hypothetical protein ACK4GN_10325 [Runella sp.]